VTSVWLVIQIGRAFQDQCEQYLVRLVPHDAFWTKKLGLATSRPWRAQLVLIGDGPPFGQGVALQARHDDRALFRFKRFAPRYFFM